MTSPLQMKNQTAAVDSEDDDQDKSPQIIYVRCGKCRTYWPAGKEIINHTCVFHPYKRVAYDPAVS
jgi:hypothetical protein